MSYIAEEIKDDLEYAVWKDGMIYVLVTTDDRGVFFGLIRPEDRFNRKKLTVFNCQMAVKYCDFAGVLALAGQGPINCNITKPVDSYNLENISGIGKATEKAVERWLACPWKVD